MLYQYILFIAIAAFNIVLVLALIRVRREMKAQQRRHNEAMRQILSQVRAGNTLQEQARRIIAKHYGLNLDKPYDRYKTDAIGSILN